ncbi:MAG: helix-turn-helix domain-containing protein [Candidatus Nitrosoglobus sp.]
MILSCSRSSGLIRTLRGTFAIEVYLLLYYNDSMVTQRAYKFRLYPIAAQRRQLATEFIHCR